MARQAQQIDMADAEAICETPEPISFVLTRPLALIGECPRRAKTWPRPRQATLVVIVVATSIMRRIAFMLPRRTLPGFATRHKLGIQRYKGRAAAQIAILCERAA